MTVVPSAGVEMDIGRLLGDMKWRKEDKLMPGVKFGIKYKSATRHRNEVHGRQPLADINTNQISRATGGGDNVTGQEQNEEGEQQETRRRKKRQRLEIPGLLHPDDLTPSRQRTNSYVGNTATKRRGKQQDKQQHTGEAGEPTQHYLVSLVRNCHRQLYGDPNKCSGQMQGEGDSTSQLPPSASSSRQLVIPSYSMDNYSLVQDATLYGPTVEENAPSIAPEKSMWQGMEWNGNGGRSDVIGQQGMWRRAAPVEGSIKLLNGVSDSEAKVNSSGSHGDRVAGERVWQWLTQDGDGARDKTCKLESRPVAENSNGFGLWRGWESPGNHDLPHQNPHSYHQATAAHHHMKNVFPTSLPPTVSEDARVIRESAGDASNGGRGDGGGGKSDGGGSRSVSLHGLHTSQQDPGPSMLFQPEIKTDHVLSTEDPQRTASCSLWNFVKPPPPPPSTINSAPYFLPSTFPYLPSSPSHRPRYLPLSTDLFPPPAPPSSPPAPSSPLSHSFLPHLFPPPLPPSPRVPIPASTSTSVTSPPPPPPATATTSAVSFPPSPPLQTQPSASPPTSSFPATQATEFSFSPKPSQHQDVLRGGMISTIELVAVSHLESNMVFRPHLGWPQQYSTSRMSGQQAARVFNVLPRPSANDFHLPGLPVTASHDLLNLYSNS